MLLRVALVGLMVFTAGCSRGEKLNRLPVFKVRGVVTLKGNPVANADITFLNAEANRGAFAKTNEKGEYELTTYTSFDGAVAGKHSVSIVHTPPPANMPVLPSTEDAGYQPPKVGESTLPPVPKSNVPAEYADPATSGLIAVVNEDNENVIDFALTEQVSGPFVILPNPSWLPRRSNEPDAQRQKVPLSLLHCLGNSKFVLPFNRHEPKNQNCLSNRYDRTEEWIV